MEKENNNQNMVPNDNIEGNKNANVPNLRFKGFDCDIQILPCRDLLKFHSTNSLSWEDLNYTNGMIKNLHYGLIHSFKRPIVDDFKDIPFINEGKNPSKYVLINSGDVLFADASEDTIDIGKCIEFINVENDIVAGLHTIHASNKTNLFVNGFKGYAFNSYAFHKQIRRLSQGTKIYSINTKNIESVKIGIPSIKEQEKIVDLFYKIDQRIETQNKIISALGSQKKALSQYYFKQSKIKEKEGYIPIQLKQILIERKTYSKKDDTYPHVTLSKEGIYDKGERYNRDFLVKDENKEYKTTLLNDICYNPANLKFGVICRNTYGSAIFSPIYVTYEINHQYDPHYIELYLTNEDFIGRVLRYEQGTVYERMAVSSDDFLRSIIYIPSKNEQKRISDIFSALENKLCIEQTILQKYKEQKKFLLSNMFI